LAGTVAFAVEEISAGVLGEATAKDVGASAAGVEVTVGGAGDAVAQATRIKFRNT
jgi:hypothetical protein